MATVVVAADTAEAEDTNRVVAMAADKEATAAEVVATIGARVAEEAINSRAAMVEVSSNSAKTHGGGILTMRTGGYQQPQGSDGYGQQQGGGY